MGHHHWKIPLLACLLAVWLGSPARASFIGETVNADLVLGALTIDQGDVIVADPGVEWTGILAVFEADLSANQILITMLQNQTLPAEIDLVFSDALGAIPAITGATLGFSDVAGFVQANIASTADTVTLVFDGLTVSTSDQIQVDVTFVSVPEPGTAALVLCGLLALGAQRRTHRQL